MKVLITGANGQLGQALQASAPAGIVPHAFDRSSLDLTDAAAVAEVMARVCPDLVINTAAYTAVDRAEAEREVAFRVNEAGARNLAEACAGKGSRLLHISTDFVFDGEQSHPYTPGDKTAPLSVYGASKLAGELAVQQLLPQSALILRTSWLYAADGQNFVKTMLRLMGERERLGVIADQVGTPTHARGLAEACWGFAGRPELYGVYHWSDAGVASWYDFAVAIMEEGIAAGLLDTAIPITPLRTGDYPTAAVRPSYSVLDKSASVAALGVELKHWRVALREMLAELAGKS